MPDDQLPDDRTGPAADPTEGDAFDGPAEVHVFIGQATAVDGEGAGYPLGERHAFMLFLRQAPESEPDMGVAKLVLEDCGWGEVEWQRAGVLPGDTGDDPDQPFARESALALKDGAALVVYGGDEG